MENEKVNIKKLIGMRVKELRKAKHLSQEVLAEMLDISQNALSYIETGENFVSAETLEKIITVLDIEPQELFTFSHLQPNDKLIMKIVEILEQNPEKVPEIYKIIRAVTL